VLDRRRRERDFRDYVVQQVRRALTMRGAFQLGRLRCVGQAITDGERREDYVAPGKRCPARQDQRIEFDVVLAADVLNCLDFGFARQTLSGGKQHLGECDADGARVIEIVVSSENVR
jgi:hypothetical protein